MPQVHTMVYFDVVRTYQNILRLHLVVRLLLWVKNPGMEPIGMIPLITN